MRTTVSDILTLVAALAAPAGLYAQQTRTATAPFAPPTTQPAIAATTRGASPSTMPAGTMDVTATTLVDRAHLTGQAEAFWTQHVSESGRVAAVLAARADAMRRLGQAAGQLAVGGGMTVRRVLDRAELGDAEMQDFLPAARATGVRYFPDAPLVEVRASAEGRAVLAAVRTALRAAGASRDLIDLIGRRIIAAEVETLTATGLGAPTTSEVSGLSAAQRHRLTAIRSAPVWAERTLRAVGAAAFPDEPGEDAHLAVQRQARRKASAELRRRILQLPAAGQDTVGDVLADRPPLGPAFERFMDTARPSRMPPGELLGNLEPDTGYVVLEIELRPLWDLLAGPPAGEPDGPDTQPAGGAGG